MLLSIALAAAGASRRSTAAPSRRAVSVPQGPRTAKLPSPDNPLVAIRLLFQVGAADDPAGKEGLAALTAAMLGEAGTKRRSWSEVLDALYPMAACPYVACSSSVAARSPKPFAGSRPLCSVWMCWSKARFIATTWRPSLIS